MFAFPAGRTCPCILIERKKMVKRRKAFLEGLETKVQTRSHSCAKLYTESWPLFRCDVRLSASFNEY
jgi:hypothetical protein